VPNVRGLRGGGERGVIRVTQLLLCEGRGGCPALKRGLSLLRPASKACLIHRQKKGKRTELQQASIDGMTLSVRENAGVPGPGVVCYKEKPTIRRDLQKRKEEPSGDNIGERACQIGLEKETEERIVEKTHRPKKKGLLTPGENVKSEGLRNVAKSLNRYPEQFHL